MFADQLRTVLLSLASGFFPLITGNGQFWRCEYPSSSPPDAAADADDADDGDAGCNGDDDFHHLVINIILDVVVITTFVTTLSCVLTGAVSELFTCGLITCVSGWYSQWPGQLVGKSVGLFIERLQVRTAAGAAGEFLLQSQVCVLTPSRCPFHPRVTAVARKRPQSFCQKCRWQVTPQRSRSGLTMPLCRQSLVIYQETSSHATRQETLGHSRLFSLSHCGLIPA